MTLVWHAQATPEVAAIIMGSTGERTTYAQLDERSRALAQLVRAHGLTAGHHLAILMENSSAYLEVAWAAQRAGLQYTPLNNHLRPSEIQYVLDDCGAAALIVSEAMAPLVAGLDLGRVPLVLCARGSILGIEDVDHALARTALPSRLDESEGQEMLYSSGTTGVPKGIKKPLSGLALGDPSSRPVQLAMRQSERGLGPRSVYLAPAPLYHSAPLVAAMTMHRLGATVVVMERFDPDRCLELIERYRVTAAQFVPTMFIRMLQLPAEKRARYDVSSLEYVVHGAAPCPVTVKRQMIEWWGPIINEYYGGTEDLGSAFITAQEWLTHPGSVGLPLDECHIVGRDGQELPPGETGLVYFHSGRPFEYHNDPDKTSSVSNEHGWRTLGDVGHLDDDGYLYLTDRLANTIISGGVNIYPQEAENVLAGHPEVADVAVIGVPDAEMGEAVLALVIAADATRAGPELAGELMARCREELAAYKCPRTLEFVDVLPRDETGKLYKRLLRDRYWQGRESHIV